MECRQTPSQSHPETTGAWNVQSFIDININPGGTEVARQILQLPDPVAPGISYYEIQFPVNGQTITVSPDINIISVINAYREATGRTLTRYTVEWGVFNAGGVFPIRGTDMESYGNYDYDAAGPFHSNAVAYSIATLQGDIEIRARITHQLE